MDLFRFLTTHSVLFFKIFETLKATKAGRSCMDIQQCSY